MNGDVKATRFGKASAPMVVALVVAGITVAALAWLVPWRDDGKDAAPRPPLDVKVERVEVLATMPDTFELNGSVEPTRVVTVSAEVDGRVAAYAGVADKPTATGSPAWKGDLSRRGKPVAEGMRIAAGRPILYLNTDLLAAARDQTKARLAYDLRDLETTEKAFERKVAVLMEVEQKRTQVALTRARLAADEARLRRAAIHAPAGGTLNRLLVEEGEYVQVGEAIARIVETVRVNVVVHVPERDIAAMKVGQTHEIFESLGEKLDRRGLVTYVSRTADLGTRTTRVEMTVDNSDGRLFSGQIVRVRLKRGDLTNVIMIPLAAVIPRESASGDGEGRPGRDDIEYTVYVVESGKAWPKPVTIDIGSIRGTRVRVKSGLKAGDRLIVDGHRRCGPGQVVKTGDLTTKGTEDTKVLQEGDSTTKGTKVLQEGD